MKLGIMQPYFLPYLGYWQLINDVDKYIVYDDVNYINRGWINRNNFLICGEKKMLSIPLKASSQNKLINEHYITGGLDRFLKTIKMNYSKAPYFSSVYPTIENICNYPEKNLAIFLYNSILQISNYLKFDTEILLSSTLMKSNNLKGEDKIIHICKLCGASIYINAIGGELLYHKNKFSDVGIDLKFLKMDDISYLQFKKDKFVPNLSIVDVLMFNSEEEISVMLKKYRYHES